MPNFILGIPITKGMVGQQNQYKFIQPPHIHISLNNKQLASYNLKDGSVFRSNNPRIDKIVLKWLLSENNRQKVLYEWNRFHGDKI